MERNFLVIRHLLQQLPPRTHGAETHSQSIPFLLKIAAFLIMILLTGNAAYAQGCGMCELVGRIDRSEIIRTISELSGADSVTVDGERVLIATRATLLPEKDLARKYLLDRVVEAGYEPLEQWFLINIYHPYLLTAAVSVTGDSLWAGSDEGEIFLLTAGGGWQDPTVIAKLGILIYDLEVDHYGTLWVAGKTIGANYGELQYSTDGGLTWQAKIIGNSYNNIFGLNSIVFCSPIAAFVSGANGTVLIMRYFGGDWITPYKMDSSDFYNRQLYGSAGSGDEHVWITSERGTLFESEDLGASWTPAFLADGTLRDVDFHGPDRGIVVGTEEVFHTADGGGTWEMVSVGTSLYTVSMIDTVTAVAAGADGVVLITGDGGTTWSQVQHDCPRDEDIFKTIHSPDGGVWAAGMDKVLRLGSPEPITSCESIVLADSTLGSNIIFSNEGQTYPDERIVLCAHYDSRSWEDPYCAPGADDNASGCAGVLEAARIFSGASFQRSIDYILFDGEETGIIGSRAYVAERDTDLTIKAVVNLDMIGRDYGGGVRLELSGREGEPDSSLMVLVEGTARFLQLNLDCNYLRDRPPPTSDHKAFWSIDGVPAILLIEGEWYNNPHYHECSDVALFIDFDFATDVVRAAAGTVVQLAGLISADSLPSSVVLHQNYPNPLFSRTKIRFELPASLPVDLTLFDLAGRKVAVLIRDTLGPGEYEYTWDGANSRGVEVASGVYFLRLRAGETDRVRKIVVLR